MADHYFAEAQENFEHLIPFDPGFFQCHHEPQPLCQAMGKIAKPGRHFNGSKKRNEKQ